MPIAGSLASWGPDAHHALLAAAPNGRRLDLGFVCHVLAFLGQVMPKAYTTEQVYSVNWGPLFTERLTDAQEAGDIPDRTTQR
jgi:hypothetical protein